MALQNVTDTFTLVQSAGDVYRGDEGDQNYIITPNLVEAGATIQINDLGGNNTIELAGGLEITNTVITSNEAQLTLSNGAVINVRGADTFNFATGANSAAGQAGVVKDFATFAQEDLGLTVPAEGETAEAGTVTVNEDGTVTEGGDGGNGGDATFSLTEALAAQEAGELPEEYTIADTLENIAADEAGLVEGAASYTLTDDVEGFDYAGLTEDEQLLVDGAENGADFGGNTDGGDNGEFGLASALENLQDANAAQAGFLEGLDLDDNPETATTEADVADAVDSAVASVDGEVEGNYTNASANVRAALVADQQATNATALTQAQEALTDAQTAVAEVNGLEQAVANLQSAQTALDNAKKAAANTAAAQAGAEASYESLNDTTITIDVEGTVSDLIVENDAGDLVLADGVTEEDNEGVTDLLNAIQADQAADAAVVDAQASVNASQEVVNNLDLTEQAQTALEAVAADMTVVDLAEGELPTQSQIQAEIDGLQALVDTAQAAANEDAAALRADADAAAAADVAMQTDATTLRADADAAAAADVAEQTDATALRADADAAAAADTAAETDAVQLRANADAAEAADAFDASEADYAGYDAALAADVTAVATAAGDAQTAVDDFATLAGDYEAALEAYDTAESGSGSTATEQDALVEAYQALKGAYTTSEDASVVIGGSVSATDAAAVKTAESAIATDIQEETAALNTANDTAQANQAAATAADALQVLISASTFANFDAAEAADATSLNSKATAAEQADDDAQGALAGSSFETVADAAAADAAQLADDAAAAEQADDDAQGALAGSSFETVDAAAAADAAQLATDASEAEQADTDAQNAVNSAPSFSSVEEAAAADAAQLDADATAAENADDGVTEAQANLNAFTDLVDAYEALNGENPLLGALENAETGVENAQQSIDDLADALAGLETAQNNAETLEGLNDAIADAEAAFADNGFETPVTVDGNELATAQSDIFLLGEDGGSIANFGLLGDDALYVGTDFTQTDLAGDAVFTDAQGDASVQEVFVQQDGNNTVLSFEDKAFAGSGSSDADLTQVTLTGVNAADVSISDDGFLTVA